MRYRSAHIVSFIAAALGLTACGGHQAAAPQPTVTVTASPSPRASLNFDQLDKNQACFELGTYQGAKRDNDPKTEDYAIEAQDTAGEVNDPRWSALSDLPADEAMSRLAALCKEIHYSE